MILGEDQTEPFKNLRSLERLVLSFLVQYDITVETLLQCKKLKQLDITGIVNESRVSVWTMQRLLASLPELRLLDISCHRTYEWSDVHGWPKLSPQVTIVYNTKETEKRALDPVGGLRGPEF